MSSRFTVQEEPTPPSAFAKATADTSAPLPPSPRSFGEASRRRGSRGQVPSLEGWLRLRRRRGGSLLALLLLFHSTLALVTLPSLANNAIATPRTWTSTSGTKLQAEFVKLQYGRVYLKKADGQTVQIPLTSLSATDQKYVKSKTPPASSPSSPALATRPSGGSSAAVGYLGDGSAYTKSPAPTKWSGTSGVKWKTPLCNWGYAAPVPVAGRVFVMTEPGWKHAFPVLNCFDANSGKLLWQKEVNQLPATGLSSAQQKEILEKYTDALEKWRTSYQLFHDWQSGKDAEGALKKMAEIGLVFDPKNFNASYGALRKASFPWKEFCWSNAGFQSETWQHGCGYSISAVGQCFPTPVSDGQYVYVATAFMGFACYDMNGNLKWMKFSPGSYGGKWGVDYCKFARSPLLYKDLLISDLADKVRAFDPKTGELKWFKDLMGGKCTSMVLPTIINCDGTDILLTKGNAYKLPNGEDLVILQKAAAAGGILAETETGPPSLDGSAAKPKAWSLPGITRLVKHDEPNIVFFTGGGEHGNWPDKGKCDTPPPMAVRFTLKGKELTGEILWCGIDGKAVCGHTGMVYHGGKLYMANGRILDAKTGRVIAGGRDRNDRATPVTRHMLWIAGNHVYGVKSHNQKDGPRQGMCEVYDLNGKKVAANILPMAPVESEKAAQIIQQTGYPSWEFSYSSPFAIADGRIYIRSNDHLWCIGK